MWFVDDLFDVGCIMVGKIEFDVCLVSVCDIVCCGVESIQLKLVVCG